jgi:3-oxoacyl-[acyl-carrier protein] reductase
MDLGLSGKVGLVAASSRGIGKAIARGLSGEGMRVVVNGRDETVLNAARDEIAAATGAEVVACAADVSRPGECERLVQTTLDHFGRLDFLLANAGGPGAGRFEDLPDERWQAGFEITLMSTVRLIRAAVPPMRQAGGGRTVVIMSNTVKQPALHLTLSNAFRPGAVALARALATELARDNILVNSVLPGRIDTDALRETRQLRAEREGRAYDEIAAAESAEIPLGRFGTPEEIAHLVVFLASDKASYITGQALVVDGGLIRSTF